MRFDRPIFVLLMLASLAWGQDVVIEGPKQSIDRNIITLKAVNVPAGGFCRWYFKPELRKEQYHVSKDRRSVHFTAKPGSYKVVMEANWYVAPVPPSKVPEAGGADASLDVVVLVDDGTPVDPVPADPVKPDPKPVPLDPLAQSFQDAFTKDTETDRIDLKNALASLYEYGATEKVLNAAKNAKKLDDAMRATMGMVGFRAGSLANLQEAVHAHIAQKLPPVEDAPLTPGRKASTKVVFREVAQALRAIR